MLTRADTVKKLHQLRGPASSRTLKGSIKNFSTNESSSLNKGINWPDRENSPSPLLIRKPSPDPRSGSVRGRKTSDEKPQQVSSTQTFEIWLYIDAEPELKRSETMPDSPPRSNSKFDSKERRHKKTSEGSSLQLRHKATITSFPLDPPFDFQLKNQTSKGEGKDEDEAGQVSPSSVYSDQSFSRTSNACESVHESQHWHQHEYQLQPQRFSPTPSFDSNDHNLHECPFYTNEVSNLKLQIIELEYINATLESKVRKYRDEIRLFKQDIKGYKLDGRQFAEILKEKEKEIETLHRKIAQLLNQGSLPSPPRSTPSPMNGGSYKRYGHIADLSVKRRGLARNESTQRSGHGAEQIGRAEMDNNPQWWM